MTTTKEAKTALHREATALRGPSPTNLLEVANGLLGRFSYTPGCRFLLEETWSHPGLHVLRMTRMVADANAQGDASAAPIEITATKLVDLRDLVADRKEGGIPVLKRWLREVIAMAEDHEIDEWFRFDGEHVRDPHPELMMSTWRFSRQEEAELFSPVPPPPPAAQSLPKLDGRLPLRTLEKAVGLPSKPWERRR